MMFPQYQDGSWKSNFKLGLYGYWSLIRTPTLLRRVMIGSLTMFFQQWTGVMRSSTTPRRSSRTSARRAVRSPSSPPEWSVLCEC